VGPYDDFAINYSYRVYPQAKTPEDERPILNKLLLDQKGPFPYRYLPQQYSGIDPRNQTEDLSDDQVRASAYALANMKRVIPQLVAWTTRPGDDYTDLNELYGEALGMWSLYMGHVANWIGGVYIDLKNADQSGPVYHVVPKAREKAALAFLNENVFNTPAWLAPQDILSRIGSVSPGLETRQATVITQLLDARRLGRLAEAAQMNAAQAYPLDEFLDDLRRDVFTANVSDPNRRAMQRVYIERLGVIVSPPVPLVAVGGVGFGGGGFAPAQAPLPFLGAPNVARSDLPALARSQLRAIKAQAKTNAASAGASALTRAHWNDIADRVDAILEPARRGM
jgi:hypothetical protein